jgi:hypothetical protein
MAMTFQIPGYNPLIHDKRINLTYDDLLAMSDAEFGTYIEMMREEVRRIWDAGIAPSTGWEAADVEAEFVRLAGFPVHEMWRTDELTGNRVILNTNTLGNAVNAWNLDRMLRTRINYTEANNGKSIYDYFADPKLFRRYLPYGRRHFLRDSFYFFAQTVKRGDALPHRPELRPQTAVEYCTLFAHHTRPYGTHEILLEAKKLDKGYSGYAEHLRDAEFFALTYDELSALVKQGVFPKVCGRVLRDKELNKDHAFHVRMYAKGQRLFPAMFKSFRVSMCQYAVQYPPLTAKLIYETFLDGLPDDTLTVWDPSSGWGGRILGAMSSELRTSDNTAKHIHYIGTDPNPDFYANGESVYGTIADFYNRVRVGQSLFDTGHTYTMFQSGSEVAQHIPEFQRYKGKLDLVFTSPPYFNREGYSADENQSCHKYSAYDSWRDGFLRDTIQTAYDYLKPNRKLVWNIADIKVGGDKYIPLQADSVRIAQEVGFTHVETIYMALRGMPGANRVNSDGELTARNMCKVNGRMYKHEPVFVFHKP